MPHVAELSYPGRWLDHDDHEWSLRVEGHFHRLERFLAEAAIALDLFEAAMREREGHGWRREGWRGGALPESYEHLVPYVHARAFLGAMDDVGRLLAALEREAGCPVAAREARRLSLPGDAPPPGGMLVLEEREARWYALRDAADWCREVELSADSLFAARDCVQAAIRALSWRGPCRRFP